MPYLRLLCYPPILQYGLYTRIRHVSNTDMHLIRLWRIGYASILNLTIRSPICVETHRYRWICHMRLDQNQEVPTPVNKISWRACESHSWTMNSWRAHKPHIHQLFFSVFCVNRTWDVGLSFKINNHCNRVSYVIESSNYDIYVILGVSL